MTWEMRTTGTKKDEVHPQDEGPGNNTKLSIKKREMKDSLDDIQLISDTTKTMDMLKLKVAKLVKNMAP